MRRLIDGCGLEANRLIPVGKARISTKAMNKDCLNRISMPVKWALDCGWRAAICPITQSDETSIPSVEESEVDNVLSPFPARLVLKHPGRGVSSR